MMLFVMKEVLGVNESLLMHSTILHPLKKTNVLRSKVLFRFCTFVGSSDQNFPLKFKE